VLAVGIAPAVVESIERAAGRIPTAEVVTCSLKSAPTRVAELWPFAIVMSEDLYGFDAPEFDALARDVSARLITVGAELDADFEHKIGEKLLEAYRRRME
jgi:hypothetical protein